MKTINKKIKEINLEEYRGNKVVVKESKEEPKPRGKVIYGANNYHLAKM